MSSDSDAGHDRRFVIKLLAGGTGLLVGGRTFLGAALADDAVKDVDLKPGTFIWQPELSPDGPVAIIVSIPEQLVFVYRNGIRIAVSTCSTGKPGHDTPTGVFTILEKAKVHYSSTYDEAPMPNMERLTWNGVALHAGNLPGYPASHGCVRLPPAFAANLFTVTDVGTPVIVAGDNTEPSSVTDPGLILGTTAEAQAEGAVDKETEAGLRNDRRRHVDPGLRRRQVDVRDRERRHRRGRQGDHRRSFQAARRECVHPAGRRRQGLHLAGDRISPH